MQAGMVGLVGVGGRMKLNMKLYLSILLINFEKMDFIPDIFGKNERYIGILPMIFWIYYFTLNRSIFTLSLSLLGLITVVIQVYMEIIKDQIKEGKIKDTKDLSIFMRKNPVFSILGFLSFLYMVYTILYGFFNLNLISDQLLTVIFFVNLIGFSFRVLSNFLSSKNKNKIREISHYIRNR
jgi:hypothetical protein